jgi:hypothetical protein
MKTLGIILIILGIIALIEAFCLGVFPKDVKKFFNNTKKIKKFGIIEAIIGALLIIISLIF